MTSVQLRSLPHIVRMYSLLLSSIVARLPSSWSAHASFTTVCGPLSLSRSSAASQAKEVWRTPPQTMTLISHLRTIRGNSKDSLRNNDNDRELRIQTEVLPCMSSVGKISPQKNGIPLMYLAVQQKGAAPSRFEPLTTKKECTPL